MIERPVSSLAEINSLVASTFGDCKVCFRGQSDQRWNLVPTAYRAFVDLSKTLSFDASNATDVERDTYREFEIAARRELGNMPLLERLSIAQHHGVPTRLLDWSLNPLVAAYFAAAANPTKSAAIWTLNLSKFPFPAGLGRQLPEGGFTIEKINHYGRGVVPSFAQPVSKPLQTFGSIEAPSQPPSTPDSTFVVWKPARIDERLQRQNGLLSWFHSFEEAKVIWNYTEHIVTCEQRAGDNLLAKFVLPDTAKLKVLEQLARLGITAHHLFADLDGLGQYLAWNHHRMIEDACRP
jgi:hypothetical protein